MANKIQPSEVSETLLPSDTFQHDGYGVLVCDQGNLKIQVSHDGQEFYDMVNIDPDNVNLSAQQDNSLNIIFLDGFDYRTIAAGL